jgi:hypothetical protein
MKCGRNSTTEKSGTFSDPERLKPGKTRQTLTEEAAEQFASLAQRLRTRGHDPQVVAHFINRLVFCMSLNLSEFVARQDVTTYDNLRVLPRVRKPVFIREHWGGTEAALP